ncbi:gluconokinase [Oceanobacillus sp. CAU 1775]
MKKKLAIGLDIGTTSVKAIAFDYSGKPLFEEESLIKTYYPEHGYAEQNPEEIEISARGVMRQLIASIDDSKYELVVTGLGSAMHSLICVDAKGKALSNMLIWSDGRAGKQASELLRTNGKEIYLRTGTPIHAMSPFTKLIWMSENQFPAYKNATYFMTMKEYLIYHWFNQRIVDYGLASSTGMFDVKNRVWDQEALDIAGIKEEQLSEIVEPTKQLAGLQSDIAKEFGLTKALPFIIGSADGQLANLGSGATSIGEVNISVGTSGAIRQFVKGTPINTKMETFTYAFTKDTSIIGGPTNNGGIVLQWLKELLDFKGSYTELIAEARDVAIGAEGILFLPYINGERAPLWDQKAKGNFYGLSVAHSKKHIIRALLEGIAFNIYEISQSLETLAGKPTKVTINGGLSRSTLWTQILADVLGEDLYLSETHHNAAWGAAWTGLLAINEVPSMSAIKENLPQEKKVTANLTAHTEYMQIYKKYKKLYISLQHLMTE